MINHRNMCYKCNRPVQYCLCKTIEPIQTKTKFIILMHPKEYKHIKNNTGRLTHLSLHNSELFIGLDFSCHKALNTILNTPENYCVILYPSNDSISLHDKTRSLHKKQLVIIIIDATWASAKPILRLSKNLHLLPRVSFTHTKTSAYTFKRQPFPEALSTMESTYAVLEILQKENLEQLTQRELQNFLNPFYAMIDFQLKFNP